ncbi:hypothetical protein [Enemella sp. A6]|uniref:hypothetical protein n=1 Tax=Enemella sp. A6 TaxID=3440152 RepID=UPI003EC009ED
MPGSLIDARPTFREVLPRLALMLGISIGLGAFAGVVWWLVTPLPGYQINQDGLASINERGLAQIFAADAWFSVIAMVGGAVIGLLASLWLARRLGWLVALVVLVDTLIAGLLCWGVGALLGPGDFSTRLAEAQAGDVVPVSLTLRSWVALLVWPFIGMLPVLIWSTLARDPEEPKPIRSPAQIWREWRDGNGAA